MEPPSVRRFLGVALGAAVLILVLTASVVIFILRAEWQLKDWAFSLTTAIIMGVFFALLLYAPRLRQMDGEVPPRDEPLPQSDAFRVNEERVVEIEEKP